MSDKPQTIDVDYADATPARYQMRVSEKLIAFLHIFYLVVFMGASYYAVQPWEKAALVLAAWLLWPALRAFRSIGESVSEPAAEHLRSRLLRGGR